MLNYDDMRDMQYREENPGYEREVGLTAGDLDDCDPEVAALVVESYAHDNARRRESNARTREAQLRQENEELRALLRTHGITAPDDRD
jgi:hypothetical protein